MHEHMDDLVNQAQVQNKLASACEDMVYHAAAGAASRAAVLQAVVAEELAAAQLAGADALPAVKA